MNSDASGSTGILTLGDKFQGYTIEKVVSAGTSADVYLARHDMLNTVFALKVMRAATENEDDEFVRRFAREAKVATALHHPNVVGIQDAGFDRSKNCYFLAMEYMIGGSLRDRLDLLGTVPAKDALVIVRQIASALIAGAKQGLVHRNLKPENIMFSLDGKAKLADLGLAKVENDDTVMTNPGAMFGTPYYMAPEQAMDSSKVDSRADIYSLGIVLFEMITGKRPIQGSNIETVLGEILSQEPIPDVRTYRADVSPVVASIIQRMCEKNRDQRMASLELLVTEIDDYLGVNASSAGAQVRGASDADAAAMVEQRMSGLERMIKWLIAVVVALLAVLLVTLFA